MSLRDKPIPTAIKWLFGPLLLATGGLCLAVACGWLDVDPTATRAPLWILGAMGVSFVAMGLVLLLDGFAASRPVRGWLAFVFLVSFAAIFNWVAFAPGVRHFTTRAGFGGGTASVATVAEGGELGGRIAFGVVALLLDLLIASPVLLWLWRRRRPSTAPPGAPREGA